ncbi:MAG: hypothetical protein HQL21_04715 [Candidatus Omnitrophica bacterium]|nr:hypothetical protein [Candidatus Omnitrophota bacterium]
MKILFWVLLFCGSMMTYAGAASELSSDGLTLRDQSATGKPLEQRVQLILSREQAGLFVEFRNVSSEPVDFFLLMCRACFWSWSVDGGSWERLDQSRHVMRCRLSNKVILPVGEARKEVLEFSVPPGLRGQLKVRYQYVDRGAQYLESNVIDWP